MDQSQELEANDLTRAEQSRVSRRLGQLYTVGRALHFCKGLVRGDHPVQAMIDTQLAAMKADEGLDQHFPGLLVTDQREEPEYDLFWNVLTQWQELPDKPMEVLEAVLLCVKALHRDMFQTPTIAAALLHRVESWKIAKTIERTGRKHVPKP